MVKYCGTIESSRKDKHLANTDNIYDKRIGEMQEDINQRIKSFARADEEDITKTKDDFGTEIIKFADRPYSPSNFSGKGYKILRKNVKSVSLAVTKIVVLSVPTTDDYLAFIINDIETHVDLSTSTDTTAVLVAQKIANKLTETMEGYNISVQESTVTLVRKYGGHVSASAFSANTTGVTASIADSTQREYRNVLEQSMVVNENTTYEIRYDYDIDGKTVEIPKGCILKINGGSLCDGAVRGNNTIIADTIAPIITNINLTGTWCLNHIRPEWFGMTFDASSIQEAIDFCYNHPNLDTEVILLPRCYTIDHSINVRPKTHLRGCGIGKTILKASDDFTGNIIQVDTCVLGFDISQMTITGNEKCEAGIRFFVTTIDGSDAYAYLEDKTQAPKTTMQSYKISTIENILVTKCYNGLVISQYNYLVKVLNSTFARNTHLGIFNTSTDNMFSNLYIENNGTGGISEYGYNNKWENLKIIWNGKDVTLGDEANFMYLPNALFVWGSKNLFTNVECQDNYGHNVFIDGQSNSFVNLLLESNYQLPSDNRFEPYDIIVRGKYNSIEGIKADYSGHSYNHTTCYFDSGAAESSTHLDIKDGRGSFLQKSYAKRERTAYLSTPIIFSNESPDLDNGYIKAADDTFFSPSKLPTSTPLSIIVDFVYNNKGKNNISLLGGRNGIIEKSIGLSVGKGVKIHMYYNTSDERETTFFSDYEFESNKEYRIIIRNTIINGATIATSVSLSYCDGQTYVVKKEEISLDITFNSQSDLFSYFGLPSKDTDNVCTYKKVVVILRSISSKYDLCDHTLDNIDNEAIISWNFVNFCCTNKAINILSKLPSASAIYDGLILRVNTNGQTIKYYTCVNNGDSTYDWVEVYRKEQKKQGTSSERPTGVDIGFVYKDTTLNQLIVWNGESWLQLQTTTL